jgi:hypothetical protein
MRALSKRMNLSLPVFVFQVLITIMASVGAGSAYAVRPPPSRILPPKALNRSTPPQTDVVAVQRVYYNQIYNFSC